MFCLIETCINMRNPSAFLYNCQSVDICAYSGLVHPCYATINSNASSVTVFAFHSKSNDSIHLTHSKRFRGILERHSVFLRSVVGATPYIEFQTYAINHQNTPKKQTANRDYICNTNIIAFYTDIMLEPIC